VNPWGIEYNPTTAIETEYSNNLPSELSLSQNYPNPFNPSTKIEYTLPVTSNVTLTVYNVLGQEVKRLVNNLVQNSGKYTITWDANDTAGSEVLSSGIYIYQLRTDKQTISKKMVLLK
jgi:hypothetical protein